MYLSKQVFLDGITEYLKPIEPDSEVANFLSYRGIGYETYDNLESLKIYDGPENVYTLFDSKKYPLLISRLTDSKGEFSSSIQRLFVLKQENGNYKSEKRSLGSFKECYIKLYNQDEDLSKIAIVEGLVTGLSVRKITNLPIICALTASNIANILIPDTTKEVLIFADRDLKSKAGEKAAKKFIYNNRDKEFVKLVIMPPKIFPDKSVDWNDILLNFDIEEARKYFEEEYNDQCLNKSKKYAPSPFEIAYRIVRKIEFESGTKWMLIYHKKKWYQRSQDNVFEYKTDKEVESLIVSFMHEHKIATHRIKSDFIKNVCLNLKAFLGFNDLIFPQILNIDVNPRTTLFTKNHVLNIVDSETKLIEVADTNDVFTKFRIPIDFDDKAECPIWNKFLGEISKNDLDFQKLLQEFAGFMLTEHYDFHKFLYIYGNGRNGKGVIATVFRALLGQKMVSSLSIEDLNSDLGRFRISNLNEKLLNITNEGNFKKSVNVNVLKDLVSGGTLTVEQKHQDPFDMTNSAKFMILSNEYLKLQDNSDAGWSRVLLLKIDFQILDTKDQKPELSDINWWRSQPRELSGILNWAIKGRQRLYANDNFTEVKSAQDLLVECKNQSNFTRSFLLDNYEAYGNSRISSLLMYERYKAYCADGNYRPLNLTDFIHEVELTFPHAIKTQNAILIHKKRTRGFIGIRDFEDKDTHSTSVIPLPSKNN